MTIGLTWRRTARRIKRLKEGVLTILQTTRIARPPTFWRSRQFYRRDQIRRAEYSEPSSSTLLKPPAPNADTDRQLGIFRNSADSIPLTEYIPFLEFSPGSAISTLSVPLRHTGLEPDFGSPLGASDARVASSAGEPGSADFVLQGRGSAANVPPTDGRNDPYHHPKPGQRGWGAHRRTDSAGNCRGSKT